MIGDRRQRDRAGLTRRDSFRIPHWKYLQWQVEGDASRHQGVLVGISETGFAFLADPADAPPIRAKLILGGRTGRWSRTAEVVRVDDLCATQHRIAARFIDAT